MRKPNGEHSGQDANAHAQRFGFSQGYVVDGRQVSGGQVAGQQMPKGQVATCQASNGQPAGEQVPNGQMPQGQAVGQQATHGQVAYQQVPNAYQAQVPSSQAPGYQVPTGQMPGMYVQPQAVIDSKALKKMNKKKHKVGFWIAIAIGVIALVAAVLLVIFMNMPHQSNRTGSLGQLEGKTREEIQAELDRVVEEGMFNISIASAVTFEDGTSEGEMKIENVPGNPYLMQVEISRNDTGDVIYESGILEPNYHIQFDALDVDLDAGEYPCTATFHALDPDTEEEVGVAAAVMNVRVLN